MSSLRVAYPECKPTIWRNQHCQEEAVADNAEQGGTLPHTVLITSFLTGANLPGRALRNASTHVHRLLCY